MFLSIGVICFKLVHIIVWWTNTDSLINGDIFILECIIDILNPGSNSMHSRNRNVDSEGVNMCHWTVRPIKTNTLNVRTPIFKVACNKFPYITTVVLLNTWINEWTADLYCIRGVFDQYGMQKKADIFAHFVLHKKSSFQNCLWETFIASPMFFEVRGFYGRLTSKCETTGLI